MSHPHRRVSYNPCPVGPNESVDRRPRNNVNGGGHGLPKLMGGLLFVDARSGWRCGLLRGGKWSIFSSGISSGASESHRHRPVREAEPRAWPRPAPAPPPLRRPAAGERPTSPDPSDPSPAGERGRGGIQRARTPRVRPASVAASARSLSTNWRGLAPGRTSSNVAATGPCSRAKAPAAKWAPKCI
jgi:hypothetical protein